ncbi:MAG: hypothetical protein KJ574_00940 [Nanoarchaeota archaeon]|nr:hypothetical protein [Nanoarchaeota archaeon]
MAIQLGNNKSDQDFVITEGDVEVRGLLEDTVILCRPCIYPEQFEAIAGHEVENIDRLLERMGVRSPARLYPDGSTSKAVAYVSPQAISSGAEKDKLAVAIRAYAKSRGIPPESMRDELDVHVFGGDGFFVQELLVPPAPKSRVAYPLNNGTLAKDFLIKELGLRIWPVSLTPPNTIAEDLERIGQKDEAIRDALLRCYSKNPSGMKKDLFINPNGSYLYVVRPGPHQPDTSHEMNYDEYIAQMPNDY